MRLARLAETNPAKFTGAGETETALGEKPWRERHARRSELYEAADKVDVERLADERQSRENEIKLHRDLALQLIDLG
jgi:hypothetical protein